MLLIILGSELNSQVHEHKINYVHHESTVHPGSSSPVQEGLNNPYVITCPFNSFSFQNTLSFFDVSDLSLMDVEL